MKEFRVKQHYRQKLGLQYNSTFLIISYHEFYQFVNFWKILVHLKT